MDFAPHSRRLRTGALALALACAAIAGPAAARPLRLAEAQAMAEQHNHDLKLAAISVDNATAAIASAAAAPNPVLTVQSMNINPAAGVGAGPLHAKTVDSALRVDQLIERGAKRSLRSAAAGQLALAARADLADTRRQLRRDVAQAYYDLLAAQERSALNLDSAALAERALRAAEQRQRTGDLAGSETARLRIDALRARNDADDAAADLDGARRALAQLLGLDADADLSAADAWPAPASAPASALSSSAAVCGDGSGGGTAGIAGADGGSGAVSTATASAADERRDSAAIERRADIAAARARLQAARSSRDLALAGRTRDVTVGVQFEHYPASSANPQGSGNSIGIAVQVPLFVRYGMQGEIRSAEAALDAAGENLAKARQAAQADVARARAQAEAGARRVARYDRDLLPAARKAADGAEFAFVHGALGVMDVLDVRRAWRAAQLDALAARADYARSLAALDAALHTETND